MTTTEIRQTLQDVHQAVEVPPVDEVAFRARVRSERRRRTGSRTLLTAAAAAVLVGGVLAADQLVDRPGPDVPVADGATHPGSVPQTAWFVRDGRLTSLTPSGQVHRTDLRTEDVLGWSGDLVYATGRESRVVVLDTRGDRQPGPVQGPVQSAAVSADGRYLAWMDLAHTVTVRDLQTGRTAFTVDVARNSYVADVSDAGVLVADNVDLVLHTPVGGEVAVPTQEAGDNWGARLAGDRVAVSGPDGRSRVYDMGAGGAEPAGSLPGSSVALAPDGAVVATIQPADDDASADVLVRDDRGEAGGGSAQPLRGLQGWPQQLRFVGADTLLVVTDGSTDQADLWACSASALSCGRLPVLTGDVRLGE